MNVTHQIALVTGSNLGIGRQFVLELLERGASKVYATVRRPDAIDIDDARAFSPILRANGGGAIVNVLSALSWFAGPGTGAYAAAKAAEWNMTNSVRLELAAQGTLVQGVLLGAADTEIMAGYDGPKIDPRDAPRAPLDGLATGSIEVIDDDWTAMVKGALALG